MNKFAPVSSIMSTRLVTVSPKDSLKTVQEAFADNHIHHLPVVHLRKIVGIISKQDFVHFMGAMYRFPESAPLNESRLEHALAEEIMTTRLGKLEPTDRINVAIDIFLKNLFHALPVVEADGELVGIITPFDILKKLDSEHAAKPEDEYELAA